MPRAAAGPLGVVLATTCARRSRRHRICSWVFGALVAAACVVPALQIAALEQAEANDAISETEFDHRRWIEIAVLFGLMIPVVALPGWMWERFVNRPSREHAIRLLPPGSPVARAANEVLHRSDPETARLRERLGQHLVDCVKRLAEGKIPERDKD